jgi:BirA family biotin operon repressor/biotin-[acetyl-CoA-carboxylase] ligase
MHLPLSRAVAGRLDVMDETGSTNAVLVARASAGSQSDFSVVMTTSQTAGRGRLGRVWVAPPGRTIAVSVLLAPPIADPARLGWLPLLAGLAMTRAVGSLVTGHEVSLKWPNDVQVDGLKVAGLLAELVPGVGVVVGAGLNLTMTPEELPTPVSTSLTLVGVDETDLVDRALAAYLGQLRTLYEPFAASGLDADASGLRAAVTAACGTVGRRVRVELPRGEDRDGRATGIDAQGRLLLDDGGAVAAGDVTHLRHA